MPSEPRATPGSRASRRTYHHGQLRDALLAGARDLLAERGADAFSLNELARRVGVSTAAPYRHFADREALLCAIADEGYVRFGARLDAAAAAATDDADALLRLGVAYLGFAADEPALFDVMFRGGTARVSEVGPPTFETLVDTVARAQRSGVLADVLDARTTARTLWATLHGLAVLDARGGLAKLGLSGPHADLVAESFAPLLRPGPAGG